MKKSSPSVCVIMIFWLLGSLHPAVSYSQNKEMDSIKNALRFHLDDTTRVILLYTLSFRNAGIDADTSFLYSKQALALASKLKYAEGIFWSEIVLSGALNVLGNYPISLDHGFRAMTLAKQSKKSLHLAYANGNLAECYLFMGDYVNSLKYERECIKVVQRSTYKDQMYYMWIQMSRAFDELHEKDSALIYGRQAYSEIKQTTNRYALCLVAPVLGNAYAAKGFYDSAIYFYKSGIELAKQFGTDIDLIDGYNGLASTFKLKGNSDSCRFYAGQIVTKRIKKSYPAGMLKAAQLMVNAYEHHNADSTLKYLRLAVELKDTLFSREKTVAVQNLMFKEDERVRELNLVQARARNQILIYTSIVVVIALIAIAIIFFKNRRNKQLQQIRNGIADDLHDDIGSTLSSIGIMSELAKDKSPEALSLLNSIGESTIAMQENMSDIIWAIKAEGESLNGVLLRMQQFGTEIVNAKGIEFDFDAAESLAELDMTIHHRKNLFLFFKEVINNAAKYSEAKKVTVTLARFNKYIEMTIQDDGRGFDVNSASVGNGMNTLRKRASELNGEYRIQSDREVGTKVNLRFKII